MPWRFRLPWWWFPDSTPTVTALTDGAASIDIGLFAQYGILGIITAMLIWFAKGAHQREKDRADRLEAEVGRLHELMLDRVIPALTSATKAAEESAELLRSSTELVHAMQRERDREVRR